eukprot:14464024-Ditylum_brightwellii.AAC.1
MAALVAKRNARKLKHLMLNKQLWNSFISKFQLEMFTDKEKFKRGNDHDRVLLWKHFINHMNPLTCVLVSNLKDEIDSASLDDFNQDIKEFNTWFTNKRSEIVKEVGIYGYTEYLRCLFKAYKTAKDKEFITTIIEERHKWMFGRLKNKYKHSNLMELAMKTYNNQNKEKSTKKGDDPKFIALLSKLEETLSGRNNSNGGSNGNEKQSNSGKKKGSWKFQNPENLKQMERNGHTWKWCSNDCHSCTM